MAQKPSFLKRITTASTVAFAAAAIVGTGSTAFAQGSRATIADPATTVDGVGFDQTAAPADLVVQSAAGGVPGAVITATVNGAIEFNTPNGDFNGILLNTANNLAVTITNSTKLGFISNVGKGVNFFNFAPAANQSLTITGQGITDALAAVAVKADGTFGFNGNAAINNNDISGLGSFNFVAGGISLNFNSADATKAMTATNFKVANGAGDGIINVTNNGATAGNLDILEFNDASVATTKTINVNAGSAIRFNSTATVNGSLTLQTAANSAINLTGDATLILKSKAAAALSFSVANGTLGATGGDNNGVIFLDTSLAGAPANLTSKVPGTAVAVIGTSKEIRAQKFIAKGMVGNLTTIDGQVFAKAVELQGGQLTFGQTVDVGANGATGFTTAASQATISKNSNLGTVTFADFGGHTLTVNSTADNTTLTGNFDASGVVTAANVKPVLLFTGGNTAALAAANAGDPVVQNFKAIENNIANAVTLGAGSYTTDLNTTGLAGSGFILADGFSLTGNINQTKAAGNALTTGTLTLQGNAIINGDIGNGGGGAEFGAITLANDATKTLTLGGANIIGTNFVAGAINYQANGGTVKLTNTAANNILVRYNLNLAADDKGIFDASVLKDTQTLTISGTIGTFSAAAVAPAAIRTASKSLASFDVSGGANLDLSAGDSAINALIMGDSSQVKLSHNTYKIVTQNNGNQGKVLINPQNVTANFIGAGGYNVTTLATGTRLGSADAPLQQLQFAAPTVAPNAAVDVVLYVAGGTNVYAKTFSAAAANQGTFVFSDAGTSILGVGNTNNTTIGTAAAKLNQLVARNGTTVQVANDAFFNNSTLISANSTVQIAGNYTAKSIVTDTANTAGGILEFVNTGTSTVNLIQQANSIDDDEFLTAIKVSGTGNVIIIENPAAAGVASVPGSAIATSSIQFSAQSPVTLTLPVGVPLDDISIVSAFDNTENDKSPVVVTTGVNSIIAVGQAIGTKNNIVGLGLASDNTITVNAGDTFFAGIGGIGARQGTVNLSAANKGQVFGLLNLNAVNVTTDYTNTGTLDANNTNVFDGKSITTGGQGYSIGGAITLGSATGVNSKLVIKDETTFVDNFTVNGKVANQGILTFQGDAYINGIGKNTPIALIEGTGPVGSIAEIVGDANAQNINLNGYAILVQKSAAFNGISNIDGPIGLGTNTLTFNGNSTWAANTKIFTTLQNGKLGSINIESGKVTAAGNILADVTISDQDTLGATNEKYLLINGGMNLVLPNGSSVTLDPESDINSNQRFAKYSIIQNSDDRNYYVTRSNNATAVVLDQITNDAAVKGIPGMIENVTALTNPQNTGAAQQFVTNIGNLNVANSTQAVVAVITDVDALIDKVIDNTTEHFSSIIGNRVEVARYAQLPIGAPEGVLARPEGGVVGAADDAEDNVSYGAWLKPVYTDATQKGKNGTPGYNAKTTGGIFGFDTMANDNLMVGAAIGINQTKIKYKNYKSGDKSTVNGFLVSLYGAQQLVDNFFVQGGATFNLSQIKTKSKRYTADTTNGQKITETATSNYDNMTFGGNVMLGYDAKLMDGVLLTPMAGISYLKSGDESYKETGTTLQNKQVASKFSDKTDVIVGAKVLGDVMNLSGFAFYPEAHAFVTHKISGKYAKTQAKLDGQVDFITGLPDKSAKTSYNLGLSVAARPGPQMEYGIGYDANLASKYVAHTGTLKVRVNF